MENERLSGKVVFFSDKRGWGFIKPDGWDTDLFVHHENIEMEGFRKLEKDQLVTFTLGENDKGQMAASIRIVETQE